jgi:hypothetical protein
VARGAQEAVEDRRVLQCGVAGLCCIVEKGSRRQLDESRAMAMALISEFGWQRGIPTSIRGRWRMGLAGGRPVGGAGSWRSVEFF